MNDLLEQFLVEARELIEQATADLLALEERPGDRERLDSAFRAVHTLKGSAGIVGFAAMARALHAAEDVLAAVPAGADSATPQLVGDCLTCLDQVVQWLDHIEARGELPTGGEVEADAIVRRFAARRGPGKPMAPSAPAPAPSGWVAALLARHPAAAAEAATAVRYMPDPDCFFRGEDPLALMASLPGLIALDLAPATPWPNLDQLDPFQCNLILTALLSGPAQEAAHLLQRVRNQVDIRALPAGAEGGSRSDSSLAPPARALLEAQILLLGETGADEAVGRLASAGRVAANVLRHAGRAAEASQIDRVLAESQAAGNPGRLAAAIRTLLSGSLEIAHVVGEQAWHAPEVARALRVDVERIDRLVKLTSEMTVAKNALGYAAGLARDGTDAKVLAALLKDQHALLDRLVGELQRSVLNLRVLPLRHAFQRFPRLVREIAADLGKPVRLVTEGDATEADKAIVEALSEPLLHMVRNALDHGIEDAGERAALGKPRVATIRLSAARMGEHVLVEVEDDGRGIEAAAIRRAAAQQGLASPDALAAMADERVIDLIFTPGFSTASGTTTLSGRGIGMDAVRTVVERLGGRVGVESRPGRGTTVRLILPFTVMLTRVMTVVAGGQVYGIPLDVVVGTVRIPRERIAQVGAARAFVLRNRTVPLVELAHVLGEPGDAGAGAEVSVVVANLGGQLGGLEVDRLGERMDVMLQAVDGLLAGMRGIAGTTLLGDGRVLIVLDVQELLA